jgi:hypothetical protein
MKGPSIKIAEPCIHLWMGKVKKGPNILNDIVQDLGVFAAKCAIAY